MIGTIGAVRAVGRSTADASSMLRGLIDEARRAVDSGNRASFAANAFLLHDPALAGRLVDAGDAGLAIRILFDAKMPAHAQHRPELAAAGAQLRAYGRPGHPAVDRLQEAPHLTLRDGEMKTLEHRLHSKVWSWTAGNDARALLTTASLKHPGQADVSIELAGDTARLLHDENVAAVDGHLPLQRRLLDRLAERGIVMNDPIVGVAHLTSALDETIGAARHDLRIGVKWLNDRRTVDALVAARERGVDVQLAARDVPRKFQKRLEDAGVDFTDTTDIERFAEPLHGNIVIADDARAVIGTAHPTKRALNRKPAYASRESGFVTDSAALIGLGHDVLDRSRRAASGR